MIGPLLGEGGQGSVYRWNKNKAIKVVKKSNKNYRFNREYTIAKIAGNLGIAPRVYGNIIESDNKTQRAYIMNLVNGVPLRKVSNTQAHKKNVLNAVNALHKRGIGHMNLHEDNIIIGKNGKVYIIDYGSARLSNTRVTNNNINTWLKSASHGKRWHRFYEVGNRKLLSNRNEMRRIFGN
jgi:predicted Ser/Thr protein kinase